MFDFIAHIYRRVSDYKIIGICPRNMRPVRRNIYVARFFKLVFLQSTWNADTHIGTCFGPFTAILRDCQRHEGVPWRQSGVGSGGPRPRALRPRSSWEPRPWGHACLAVASTVSLPVCPEPPRVPLHQGRCLETQQSATRVLPSSTGYVIFWINWL